MLESARDRTDRALQSYAVPAFVPETKLPAFRSCRASAGNPDAVLVLQASARFTVRGPKAKVFFLEKAVFAMRERAAASPR